MKHIIFCSFILISVVTFSQNREIYYESDRTSKDQQKYPEALLFSKVNQQVYFKHEGIEVWCDQAVFYQEDNFFRAFGHVKMNQGDTIKMFSKYAEYDGNSKFAFASDDVKLITPSNTLTTDSLFFDRQKQNAFYRSGGTVKDSVSTITSIYGNYDMPAKKYSFRQQVEVSHPDYNITSEQIVFYPETGHAYLYGPSTILSESGTVFCKKGYYDTKSDQGYFVKDANVKYENRDLYGDSIYFNRKRNYASATQNIRVVDTANASTLYGNYAEVFKDKDSIIVTKTPYIASLQQQDSLFIASDTLLITGKSKFRKVSAYYDVRLFKQNLNGKSDSLHLDEVTGITKMIGNPVLWSENNQITGDTIQLINDTLTDKLDSLKVYNNSFMIQKDTIEGFNQVKGKFLYGLFEDNELNEVNVIKNTETIYYIREENGDLFGINKALASTIKLIFEDQKIVDIYYYNQPDDKTYPESEIPPNARKLKGFNWRGEEQIRSKKDLFSNRKSYKSKPIIGEFKEDRKPFSKQPQKPELQLNLNDKSVLRNNSSNKQKPKKSNPIND